MPKRRRRVPRELAIALGALALVVAGVLAWQFRPKEPQDPYRTVAVDRGSITRSVSASGTLEALVTVDVGSQISGQIKQVLVDFNDEVRQGQVLARLDPQTFVSRVDQGRADISAGVASVRQAEAQLAAAKADYERKRVLTEKGYYAPTVLDQSQAAYRAAVATVAAARARVGQSQASLRSQQVDLDRTVIVSPINGVVVDRQIEPGQTVAATLQAPVLFRIAQDLSKVQVKISVDEADIGQVEPGQRVRFTVDAFPDDDFTGVVTQVRKQPVTEQNVVAYTVMAEADNPQGKLLPGMTANADIILDTRRDVLKVPAAALRWNPPGSQAQAAGPGGAPGFGPPAGSGGFGGGQRPVGQGAQRGQGGQAGRIVAQLDLDAAQKKKWDAIQTAMREKSLAVRASAGGDRQAMREAMRKAAQDALTQLEPSLRPDQKTKLAALRATMAQGRGGDGLQGGVVWVLNDGKPVPVPVRVGATDGSFTEIVTSRLKPGNQVITGGGPRPKAKAPSSPFGGGGGNQTRVRL